MRARHIAAPIVVVCASLALHASAAPRRPVSVSVLTEPGATPAVKAALRRRGFRVHRQAGRRLQVVVRRPVQRRLIDRLPGVARVSVAPSAYGDVVTSQGVDRTGASALADVAESGAGLRIAILDLGFGASVPGLQDRGELPPPARLTLQSFDPAAGIAGSNAYGNPTNHGELVAQTVYDYVPRARYLFVNYHTPDDFVVAVDWLMGQGVDIVVHSNNFLDGPFDGTSQLARAVDRAAAAGILWFNSAGNYGEKHWAGPWVDGDGDGALDWPGPVAWTFAHDAGAPLTFHLSWSSPVGSERSDVDLFLERQRPDGGWEVAVASTERQASGAPPAERIAGHVPRDAGVYRLRAQLVSGPPPARGVTLFSREDDLVGFTASTSQSVPTPADAAGAISVAALDWRSNSLVRYSSRGPTADGRQKPDVSAPTGTSLATLGGDPRDVGGTSIATPNAAGAAALALAAMRASGLRPGVDAFRALLAADALDLGERGPDSTFGAGRIRVDTEPPALRPAIIVPRAPVRGDLRVSVEATDAGGLATWALSVDGARVRIGRVVREVINARVPARDLADGRHDLALDVGDAVGNVRRRSWRVVTDNTAPTLALDSVDVLPVRRAAATSPPAKRHVVRVVVGVGDAISRSVRVTASLTNRRGRRFVTRRVDVPINAPRRFVVGRVPRGVYVLRLSAADSAGNTHSFGRVVRVRG